MRNFASIRRGLFAVLGLALTFSIAQPAAAAIIGGSVIVQNTGEVVATYRGNSAQFSNDLYLDSPDGFFRTSIIFNNHASPIGSSVSLGSFTAGTELIFHLHVNDTGNDWFTGPPRATTTAKRTRASPTPGRRPKAWSSSRICAIRPKATVDSTIWRSPFPTPDRWYPNPVLMRCSLPAS